MTVNNIYVSAKPIVLINDVMLTLSSILTQEVLCNSVWAEGCGSCGIEEAGKSD